MLISPVVREPGFGRTWPTASRRSSSAWSATRVAGRLRVPPLVVVVSAVVPMLPGLSIYRGLSLLAEGGSGTSQGLLAMMTAASVAIALSVRRDPRRVRRPAAQAGGAAVSRAGCRARGWSARSGPRSGRAGRRLAGEPGHASQPAPSYGARRRTAADALVRRSRERAGDHVRRGSRTRPGARRTRPRRRPTPGRCLRGSRRGPGRPRAAPARPRRRRGHVDVHLAPARPGHGTSPSQSPLAAARGAPASTWSTGATYSTPGRVMWVPAGDAAASRRARRTRGSTASNSQCGRSPHFVITTPDRGPGAVSRGRLSASASAWRRCMHLAARRRTRRRPGSASR